MTGATKYPSSKSKTDQIRFIENCLEETLATLADSFSEVLEDVVVFIGTTKAGKSTLLNALLGNNLVGEITNLRSISVTKADDKPGPKIGRGSAAETIYPTKWLNAEKLIFWDCPGFYDNRGVAQDIVNAYCIHNLFNNVKSAKIVLVVDVNDILTDRINSFLSLLTSFENLFKNKIEHLFTNVVVIFTKVPDCLHGLPVTVDFVIEVLKEQILLSTSLAMSKLARNFIEHLVENPTQIEPFRLAKVGPMPGNIGADIVKAVQSINGVHQDILKSTFPSISQAAKVFLHESRHILTSNDEFYELEKSIKAVFETKLNVYKKTIEGEEGQAKLAFIQKEVILYRKEMQSVLKDNTSFQDKIQIIKTVHHSLKIEIKEKNLIEKLKLMVFIDKLLDLTQSDIFYHSLCCLLESVVSELEDIEIKLLLKMHKIGEEKAKQLLEKLHVETKKKINRLREECKRQREENERVKRRFFSKIGVFLDNSIDAAYSYLSKKIN